MARELPYQIGLFDGGTYCPGKFQLLQGLTGSGSLVIRCSFELRTVNSCFVA